MARDPEQDFHGAAVLIDPTGGEGGGERLRGFLRPAGGGAPMTLALEGRPVACTISSATESGLPACELGVVLDLERIRPDHVPLAEALLLSWWTAAGEARRMEAYLERTRAEQEAEAEAAQGVGLGVAEAMANRLCGHEPPTGSPASEAVGIRCELTRGHEGRHMGKKPGSIVGGGGRRVTWDDNGLPPFSTRRPSRRTRPLPCGAPWPVNETIKCSRPPGHDGDHHRGKIEGWRFESWPQVEDAPQAEAGADV